MPKDFAGDFHIGAGEEARVVESVRFQGGKIAMMVKVSIQHRAVVLTACNQGNGFPTEQEIMWIRGIKMDGL